FGREVPVVALFQHPTIRALAAFLSDAAPAMASREVLTSRAEQQRAAQALQRERLAAHPRRRTRNDV
ncbi:MAG TPA: hypothetical protein VE153_06675, partial [Myxococcus sp.]|nr:hypothetical protein [Myxococcus sp.]